MAGKVIEDLVVPDLENLDARVTRLEQTTHAKIDAPAATGSDVEKTTNAKIDSLDKSLSSRLDTILATMAANHSSILHALDLHRRVQRLEALANKIQ
jgi:hypothetical protein